MTADPARPDPEQQQSTSLLRVAGPAALLMAVVLLATSPWYGLHGDELYFRCLPWAWWYDDQPPVTVWLSHLAGIAGPPWLQRVPAVLAAAAGVVLAAATPRLLGHGPRVQRVAAWAHAGTVYPLLVGHVFLTSTIDLVVWQVVLLLVLAAVDGRPSALAWTGVVAGLGCWNKLLVLVLVTAVVIALAVARPRLLWSRQAAIGLLAFALLGGPQVVAQLVHGSPMSAVSGDLIALNGGLNRWLVLPLVVAFIGPPYLAVWWQGLRWRPSLSGPPLTVDELRCESRRGPSKQGPPVLAVTAAVVTAWTLMFPAQPYYPVAAFFPALAIGWDAHRRAGSTLWRRRWPIVVTNSLVASVIALPLAPAGSPVFRLVAAADPVQRDQAGWPEYVDQIARVAGGRNETVVPDSYALAGAVALYGPSRGIPAGQVASGHNALWDQGPPSTDAVLLVGRRADTYRRLFLSCADVGVLAATTSDPFGVAGSPIVRCTSPRGGWSAAWPAFRHLGA